MRGRVCCLCPCLEGGLAGREPCKFAFLASRQHLEPSQSICGTHPTPRSNPTKHYRFVCSSRTMPGRMIRKHRRLIQIPCFQVLPALSLHDEQTLIFDTPPHTFCTYSPEVGVSASLAHVPAHCIYTIRPMTHSDHQHCVFKISCTHSKCSQCTQRLAGLHQPG
jgi:hypothetical protein